VVRAISPVEQRDFEDAWGLDHRDRVKEERSDQQRRRRYSVRIFEAWECLTVLLCYLQVATLGQPQMATSGTHTLDELRSHSSQEMKEKKVKMQKMVDKKKKRVEKRSASIAKERCG